MDELRRGRLVARRARSKAEIEGSQALRHLCFRGSPGLDRDSHDAAAEHWRIEDAAGALLACFRLIPVTGPAGLQTCYSAAFFDLAPLARLPAPMLELGRFCIRPGSPDPDILRLAWGALATRVDALGAGVLFGCSSLPGADPGRHGPALALLGSRHLAPPDRRPLARRNGILLDTDAPADPRAALAGLPALMRTYLGLGGWVAPQAVPDPDLDTLVIFTAVEIAAIPPSRARVLRAIAAAPPDETGD